MEASYGALPHKSKISEAWAGEHCPTASTTLKLLAHSDAEKFVRRVCQQFGLLVREAVLQRSPAIETLQDLRQMAQELWTKAKTLLPIDPDTKAKLRPLVEALRRLDDPESHEGRAGAFANYFTEQAQLGWSAELEKDKSKFIEKLCHKLLITGAQSAFEQFCKRRSFPITCEAVVKSLEHIRSAENPDSALVAEIKDFQAHGVPHVAPALACALLAEHQDKLGDLF